MTTHDKPQPTVLIVDDHPELRTLFRSALTLPIRILETGDGMEAMNLIETNHVDLLLTDYQMPFWDGLTLCQTLRAREDLKSIKIVLITGEAAQPLLLEAVNQGLVDAALLKPVDVHQLRQLVQRLLNLEPDTGSGRPAGRSSDTHDGQGNKPLDGSQPDRMKLS